MCALTGTSDADRLDRHRHRPTPNVRSIHANDRLTMRSSNARYSAMCGLSGAGFVLIMAPMVHQIDLPGVPQLADARCLEADHNGGIVRVLLEGTSYAT